MNLIILAQSIKELVAKGKTQDACNLLIKGLEGHPSQKEAILQSARNQTIRTEILNGTQSWEDMNIGKNQINHALLEIADEIDQEGRENTHIFISYRREGNSELLAQHLHQTLKDQDFKPFIDVEDISAGSDWASAIMKEIRESDYFILLLSESAGQSEMVIREVEEAYQSFDQRAKPVILPVRVEFPNDQSPNYKIHRLLRHIQHLNWENERDTPTTTQKLLEIIKGKKQLVLPEPKQKDKNTFQRSTPHIPTPIAPLEVPRGAVRLESPYYIKRFKEDIFIQRVLDPGALLRIKGPRQYGKNLTSNPPDGLCR